MPRRLIGRLTGDEGGIDTVLDQTPRGTTIEGVDPLDDTGFDRPLPVKALVEPPERGVVGKARLLLAPDIGKAR